jgi:hypothetical protein
MTQIKRRGAGGAALTAIACALACLGLAACGGSSPSKNASASVSSTSTSTSTSGSGADDPDGGPQRFAAIRRCLQKEGVMLPQRPAGQRPPYDETHRGGFFGGGAHSSAGHLPKGMSTEKFGAALKKCGSRFARHGFSGHGFAGVHGHFFDSGHAKIALAAFATCMRENGVKLPAPNTSGKGPVFDTKGIDTGSTQFKNAETKCASKLPGPFGGHGGGPPPQGQAGGQ